MRELGRLSLPEGPVGIERSELGGHMHETGNREQDDVRLELLTRAVKDVRHDISTPLTAILAETELLLMDVDQLNAEQRRGVEAIGEMARRIRDLVSRLEEVKLED